MAAREGTALTRGGSEQHMERRIQFSLIGVLGVVFLALGAWLVSAERKLQAMGSDDTADARPESPFEPVPPPPTGPALSDDARPYFERIDAKPESWVNAQLVAAEIASLEPMRGVDIMRSLWPHLSKPVRQNILKPFCVREGHPEGLKLLDIAARDPDDDVRGRAYAYLTRYAFRWFHTHEEYDAWSRRYTNMPIREVLRVHAEGFVEYMSALHGENLERHLLPFDILDLRLGDGAGIDLAAILKEHGVLQLIEHWLATETERVREVALSWVRSLDPNESWLRVFVLTYIEEPEGVPSKVLNKALVALSEPENDWAVEPILDFLEFRVAHPQTAEYLGDGIGSAADALAVIGAKRAIPRLIGVVLKDPTGQAKGLVGYFGLSKLTGVKFDEKRMDGAYWADWWRRNRSRFPADVAELEIPH